MKTNTTFSHSEEAFLLSSLHEVVKVWASGNGKASFSLNIENGSAELQLAFKLGHPSEEHVVQHQPPDPPVSDHGPWHHYHRR